MQSLSNLSTMHCLEEAKLPATSPEMLNAGASLMTIASEYEMDHSKTVHFKPEVPPGIDTEIQNREQHRMLSPFSDTEQLYSQSRDLLHHIDPKLIGGSPGDTPSVYEAELISPSSKSHHATPPNRFKVHPDVSPTPDHVATLNPTFSGSTKSSSVTGLTPKNQTTVTTPLLNGDHSESVPLCMMPVDNGSDDEKSTKPDSAKMQFAHSLIPHMFPDEKDPESDDVRLFLKIDV